MIITRDDLTAIFNKLDTDGNDLIDKSEFRVGYKEIAPDARAADVDVKWAAISKGAEHITLETLAAYWGIQLGTDDVATDGMSDEQIVEVMALHGLMLTMAEERKKRNEEAMAVKAAEDMLARAALGKNAPGKFAARRGSRELPSGIGIGERESKRRESKVVHIKCAGNALDDHISPELALLQAADVGEHDEVMKMLKAAKISVNVCDDRHETVLHKVARIPPAEPSKWRELLAAVRDAGIEIDYMDKGGKTALFTAAEYGRREIVNWLITNSADINHLTNDFQTVLHQAIVSNKTDVAKLLLSDQHRHKLSDINHVDAQGRTALHIASFKADQEVVQLLLESKADPSVADSNHKTAENLAERTGRRGSASLIHQAAMRQAAQQHLPGGK